MRRIDNADLPSKPAAFSGTALTQFAKYSTETAFRKNFKHCTENFKPFPEIFTAKKSAVGHFLKF